MCTSPRYAFFAMRRVFEFYSPRHGNFVARRKFFYRSVLSGAVAIEEQLVQDLREILPAESKIELKTYVYLSCLLIIGFW